MDSELEDKIKQIGSMFGFDNIPDNIGDIIESVAGNLGSGDASRPAAADNPSGEEPESYSEWGERQPNPPQRPGPEEDEGNLFGDLKPEDMMMLIHKFKSVSDAGKNDSRVKLLRALKPFLNEKKQAKIGSCIRLMSLAQLAKTKL